MKTVLIVTDDLGFAYWLGQTLDQARYEAWPARSVAAAELLLAELQLAVDLLVVAASMPGASTLMTYLGAFKNDFKVIAVCDEEAHALEQLAMVSVVRRKPRTVDSSVKREWVRLITGLLADAR
ncbi:MAG: hypothetical protein ABI759_05970 [Candidatus Solibacter sp.]